MKWINHVRRFAVAFSTMTVGTLILASLGCWEVSRDEVARVNAPGNALSAVLFETNAGATTSFGYEVRVVPKDTEADSGILVARLYAAVRNDSAYGVNLRWSGPGRLQVEFRDAAQAELIVPATVIARERVQIALRPGIIDPNAPAGGMLYNLHHPNKRQHGKRDA